MKNWCFLLSKIILIFYWEFRRGVFINMICLKLCLFCLFRKEKLSNFVNICLQILKTNVVNRVRWRHVKLDVGALIQVYVTVNMGRLGVLVLWISKSMLDHDLLLICRLNHFIWYISMLYPEGITEMKRLSIFKLKCPRWIYRDQLFGYFPF